MWDYKRGAVVCPACGLVVDSIFAYEPAISSEAREGVNHSPRRAKGTERRGCRYRSYVKERERSYKMYVRVARRVARRPHLFVDHDAFSALLERGEARGLRLICSTRNSRAEALVRLDSSLKGLLEGVVSRYPLLTSRTLRGKVAAAIAIRAMSSGESIDPRTLSELAGVSNSQARRIISLVAQLIKGRVLRATVEAVAQGMG